MTTGTPTLGLWLKWMATFLGFPIGGSLAYLLVRSMDGIAKPAIGGLVTGLVLGIAQWLVLRQVMALRGWWIIATGIGLAAGLALSVALSGTSIELRPLIVRAVMTGGVLGIAQWLLLRRHVAAAGVWIAVVTIGWALGWTVTRAAGVDLSRGWLVFGASGALAFAALTGFALLYLLRHPLSL